jgi:hypothetical protein
MYELITLFDVNYLPRALVLHRTLTKTGASFRLRALCLDERAFEVLTELRPPGIEPVALAEIESAHPELVALRHTRSHVEYAWTLTPASCLFALEREPDLREITYLDADLGFFSDPAPIYEELGEGSILVTPHRYAPEFRQLEALSGRFNVQFMIFRRDTDGLAALRWWHERCVEWCYQRHEEGRFGDQMYLNDWPERFEGVHVLEHPGAGLAPWNASAHRLGEGPSGLRVDGRELIFFHYHGLRLRETLRRRLVWSSDYPLSTEERRLLWEPYVAELRLASARVRELVPSEQLGIRRPSPRELAGRVARRIVPRPARRVIRRSLEVARDLGGPTNT